MDDTEAERWLRDELDVPRETFERFVAFRDRLIGENGRQNLISATSMSDIWRRHMIDSAQLFPLISGPVVDIGSGPGLPGIPLALLGAGVTMVEPRRLRVEFLRDTVTALNLQAGVVMSRAEQAIGSFGTITARAYAPLHAILASTLHLSHADTRWVLPKGRSAASELETARATWHGRFHLVPSVTDTEAMIVIAEAVKPKASR